MTAGYCLSDRSGSESKSGSTYQCWTKTTARKTNLNVNLSSNSNLFKPEGILWSETFCSCLHSIFLIQDIFLRKFWAMLGRLKICMLFCSIPNLIKAMLKHLFKKKKFTRVEQVKTGNAASSRALESEMQIYGCYLADSTGKVES